MNIPNLGISRVGGPDGDYMSSIQLHTNIESFLLLAKGYPAITTERSVAFLAGENCLISTSNPICAVFGFSATLVFKVYGVCQHRIFYVIFS